MVKDVNKKFRSLKLYFDIKEGRTSLKEALPQGIYLYLGSKIKLSQVRT